VREIGADPPWTTTGEEKRGAAGNQQHQRGADKWGPNK